MQGFLYDISERFRNLESALELADDKESVEAISTALCEMGGEVTEVCGGGIGYIQNMKLIAEGMKAEEDRLKKARQVIENRVKRVQNGYMDFLQSVGKDKVETSRGKMSIVKVGGKVKVIIYNAAEVPPQYLTVIPEHTEPNKEAIRAALEAGETVHGAVLEERKVRLNIS